MDLIYIAAIASFILGAVGYIIVTFWIKPISRYIKTKKMIFSDFSNCKSGLTKPNWIKSKKAKSRLKDLRKSCSDLVYIYNDDIPHWYRLLLVSRKESPAGASDPAMRLSNITDPEHAAKRLDEIKTHLLFK